VQPRGACRARRGNIRTNDQFCVFSFFLASLWTCIDPHRFAVQCPACETFISVRVCALVCALVYVVICCAACLSCESEGMESTLIVRFCTFLYCALSVVHAGAAQGDLHVSSILIRDSLSIIVCLHMLVFLVLADSLLIVNEASLFFSRKSYIYMRLYGLQMSNRKWVLYMCQMSGTFVQ
jgi:hypothetical protein